MYRIHNLLSTIIKKIINCYKSNSTHSCAEIHVSLTTCKSYFFKLHNYYNTLSQELNSLLHAPATNGIMVSNMKRIHPTITEECVIMDG